MKAIHFIDAATQVFIAKMPQEMLFELKHETIANAICDIAEQMACAYNRTCLPGDKDEDLKEQEGRLV